MIEISRYILATMVAQTHLWPLGAAWTGNIAVFAFYTLSGYLMTRVLNERYGFSARGTVAFLLNRVLRLWPAYLAMLGLTLIALSFLPLSSFFSLIRMPTTLADIVTNLAILGQVTFDFRQWLPLAKPVVTSWSLSIELFSYVLLALYFARTPTRLWAFVAVGAVAMAISTWYCAVGPEPAAYGPYCSQNRYGVLQAGFIPFAMGGLFYFHRDADQDNLACADCPVDCRARCYVSRECADRYNRPLPRHWRDVLPAGGLEGGDGQSHAGFFRSSVLSPLHRSHAYRRHLSDRSRIEGGKRFRLFRHDRRGAGSQHRLGADGAHHQPRAAAHLQLSYAGGNLSLRWFSRRYRPTERPASGTMMTPTFLLTALSSAAF